MKKITSSLSASHLRTIGALFLIATPLFFFGLYLFAAACHYSPVEQEGLSFNQYMFSASLEGVIFSLFTLPVTATGACLLVRVRTLIVILCGCFAALLFLALVTLWATVNCFSVIWPVLAFAPIFIAWLLFMRADQRQQPQQ